MNVAYMNKIIAGPAVRRIEEGAVYIWVALSQDAQVEAKAYKDPNGSAVARANSSDVRKVRMGECLFVYLLKLVRPASRKFPKDVKLYYNVFVDGEDLSDLGLISGANSITYPGEKLPSYVIPIQHKHIIEGSCRKPHAENSGGQPQRDQLIRADAILGEEFNTTSRPTMLCLTGDQIYADDVATSFLPPLTEMGRRLVGSYEYLPPTRKGDGPTAPHLFKLGNRSKPLNKNEGFTSTHGKNHLMSFGEFASMYLAVWGGQREAIPEWTEAKPKIAVKIKKSGHKNQIRRRVPTVSKRKYNKESERVETFLSNAWRTRRLMANICTYTMFDDHEVTDDWNLNRDIDQKLRKAGSLGRRLTANALAAYWVFQGWGNDPSAFDETFINTLEDHFSDQSRSRDSLATAAEKTLHKQYWGYTVPGTPALVALDIRTSRAFVKGEGPRLLSPSAFSWLEDQLDFLGDLYGSDGKPQTLLVLSPAPVFGFRPVEMLQAKLTKWLKGADTAVDAEYWSSSERTYRKFLRILSRVIFTNNILFLSGDVHYTYAAIEPNIEDMVAGMPPKIIQLTSSATCNHPSRTMAAVMTLIGRKMRTPEISYLLPEGADRVVNGHNNIASIQFEEAHPKTATFHYYDPDESEDYTWTYDLGDLKIRDLR